MTSRHRIRREIDVSRRTLGVTGRLKSQVPQLLPNQELRKLEQKTQDDHPGGELVASHLVLWVRGRLCVSFRPHDEPDHVQPKRPPIAHRRVLSSRVTRHITVSLRALVRAFSRRSRSRRRASPAPPSRLAPPTRRVPSARSRTFNKALFCVSSAAIPSADIATTPAQYPVPCHPSVPRSAHPNCACNSALAATSRLSYEPGHIFANRDAMTPVLRPHTVHAALSRRTRCVDAFRIIPPIIIAHAPSTTTHRIHRRRPVGDDRRLKKYSARSLQCTT